MLLVHRPRYDDWSFPKGKLDPGEHVTAAAVREVPRRPGCTSGSGRRCAGQRYPVAGGRTKPVAYWVGRVVGDDDVSGYRANDEIDEVALGAVRRGARPAHLRPRPRRRSRGAGRSAARPTPLVVLRHGEARSRKAWRGRTTGCARCSQLGRQQAQRLVPVLAAYDVTRIVSSSSTRCVETVAPYADTTGLEARARGRPQRGGRHRRGGRSSIGRRAARRPDEAAVLCTHRPVLPPVFDALGVDDPSWSPGAMLVVHLRQGTVTATERHRSAESTGSARLFT